MISAHLRWKLQRLRTMGVREIAFRVGRELHLRAEKLGFGLAKRPPPPRLEFGRPWSDDLRPSVMAQPYLKEADAVLGGRWSVFEMRDLDLGFPPAWNRDPKLGIEVPLGFGKSLDYRDGKGLRYTRYIWEFNRHLELVRLAQAWALSGDMRYADGARRLLESWFEQCPYPLGPHWNNSLEHGLRLVNWAVAWHLLGGAEGPVFRDAGGQAFLRRWLDSIYQHCHFIEGHFSLYSSANNHLYGEYLGLFVGALTWPCWDRSAAWLDLAQSGLEREAALQVAGDGVDREHAIGYHRAVVMMMLTAGLFGRANRHDFSGPFWSRIESMLDYMVSITDSGGHVPNIGDGDDAAIVRFAPGHPQDLYRPLLAAGAALFSRGDFKRKAGAFTDAARWLLGGAGAEAFDRLQSSHGAKPLRRAFEESGYYVLGSDFDAPGEVRLVADAGPIGLTTTGGHGHADALAFTLSLDGQPFLVDSGTYEYQAPERWRSHFRGTAAHNTVRVDGVDQSVSGGSFLWVRHARARCERFEMGDDGDIWVGIHDGYERLSDPVLHRREIEYRKADRVIRVTDHIECRGEHDVEVLWHLASGCTVDHGGSRVTVRRDPVSIRLMLIEPQWEVRVVTGGEASPQGWVSDRYGEVRASSCVIFHGATRGVARVVTEIALNPSRG